MKAKRIFDIIIASLIFAIVFLPLLSLLFFSAIYFKKFPLFIQYRVGLNERLFFIYKVRTMKDGAIPPIFKWIRTLGLDELPQLLNIIKGDMSIVGPRPILPEYLEVLTLDERRRHNVRPGITGLAQINGRNRLTWSQKFKFDLNYIQTEGFFTDIKIIMKTLYVVFKRDGIADNLLISRRVLH